MSEGERVREWGSAEVLDRYRQYLLVLARVAIDPRLAGKMDASDMV